MHNIFGPRHIIVNVFFSFGRGGGGALFNFYQLLKNLYKKKKKFKCPQLRLLDLGGEKKFVILFIYLIFMFNLIFVIVIK